MQSIGITSLLALLCSLFVGCTNEVDTKSATHNLVQVVDTSESASTSSSMKSSTSSFSTSVSPQSQESRGSGLDEVRDLLECRNCETAAEVNDMVDRVLPMLVSIIEYSPDSMLVTEAHWLAGHINLWFGRDLDIAIFHLEATLADCRGRSFCDSARIEYANALAASNTLRVADSLFSKGQYEAAYTEYGKTVKIVPTCYRAWSGIDSAGARLWSQRRR